MLILLLLLLFVSYSNNDNHNHNSNTRLAGHMTAVVARLASLVYRSCSHWLPSWMGPAVCLSTKIYLAQTLAKIELIQNEWTPLGQIP